MAHSMREFQHSIQQMVSQQIETPICNTIRISLQHFLPPSSSQTNNNQNRPNTDLLEVQLLTSFPHTASSVRISRLPLRMSVRMSGQISGGEFINFDTLLNASTSGISNSPFTVTVQQGSESLEAVCLSQQKSKTHNFGTWLASWNVYLTAYSHYHVYMTPQLLQCQTTITMFNQSYPVTAWRTYDVKFRQSRANDRSLRWDVIDKVIATNVLRTFIQLENTATTPSPVTCYRCHCKGHIASQCFANLGDNHGSTARDAYHPSDNSHSHVCNSMVPHFGSNCNRNSMMPFRFPHRWGDRSTACHTYNAVGRCIKD